jgi:hypothetical protein
VPFLGRSSRVKRGQTGRKPKKLTIARTKVVKHRHRRFRGLKTQPKAARTANRAKAIRLNQKRRETRKVNASAVRKKRVFKGRTYKGRKVKPNQKRRYLGRKKSTVKRRFLGRKVTPGLKRRYFGRTVPKGLKRRYFGRVVPKGYKRRYFGRKKVVKGPAISQQSYINMF